MSSNRKRLGILSVALSLVLIGWFTRCSDSKEDTPRGNAVYYWRTSFELSDVERKFLSENQIEAMYVKFFDVVAEEMKLRPEATLLFTDTFPSGIEIVPTVFIDSKALSFVSDFNPREMAELIVSRVDSMNVKNGCAISKEIQIDFDWTQTNQEDYFNLLSEIGERLHSKGRILSTTIRLHQLNMKAPPVDYGALMIYNTGYITSPDERNSILSMESIRPYLGKLKGYSLPLVTALPIYSWNLLFRGDQFMVIARGMDYSDTTIFQHAKDNLYVAKRYMPVPMSSSGGEPGARMIPGDILRHESAPYPLLDSVVNVLHSLKPDILNRVILYHLDEKSFTDYEKEEIRKIYRGGNN